MKKMFGFIIVSCVTGFLGSMVMADPGPYSATMTADGYDATPDAVPTPNQPGGLGGFLEIYKSINQIFINAGFVSPGFVSNASAEPIQVITPNSYWQDVSPLGAAGNFAVISLSTPNTNTLGVYKMDNLGSLIFITTSQTGFTFLGTGSINDPYPGGINPYSADIFGFALKSSGIGANTWYSDPLLNVDGIDHMLAYSLPGLNGSTAWLDINGDHIADTNISFSSDTYLLAWEDLPLTHPLFDSDYKDTIVLVSRVRPIPEPMSLFLVGCGLVMMAGLRSKINSKEVIL